MHRRLSFASALPGGLALRQRSAWTRRRYDSRSRWTQCSTFRAGDERRLATLSLSRREPFAARTPGTHGSKCILTPPLRNSEKQGRRNLTAVAARRHHRNYFARPEWTLFHCPCWSRIAHKRRRFAFHARFFAKQLRPRGRGLRAFEISISLPL